MRDKKEWIWRGGKVERKWEEMRKGKPLSGYIIWERNLLSIKQQTVLLKEREFAFGPGHQACLHLEYPWNNHTEDVLIKSLPAHYV